MLGAPGLGTHLEDDAHVSGDAGIQVLAVRSDAGGSLVDADGDYELVRSHATDEDCEAALKVYRRMAEMKSAAGKAQRELKEAA